MDGKRYICMYVYVFMNMCMIIDITGNFLYEKHICRVLWCALFICHTVVISRKSVSKVLLACRGLLEHLKHGFNSRAPMDSMWNHNISFKRWKVSHEHGWTLLKKNWQYCLNNFFLYMLLDVEFRWDCLIIYCVLCNIGDWFALLWSIINISLF